MTAADIKPFATPVHPCSIRHDIPAAFHVKDEKHGARIRFVATVVEEDLSELFGGHKQTMDFRISRITIAHSF